MRLSNLRSTKIKLIINQYLYKIKMLEIFILLKYHKNIKMLIRIFKNATRIILLYNIIYSYVYCIKKKLKYLFN